jgi:splicing factor 3A subunit 3
METLLEQQRRYHEERERLMDAMVGEEMMKKSSHREILNSAHRQRAMLDRYSEVTTNLKEIYEDKDGQRREEVAALSGPNEFGEFYARLKQIKDFHRRHPGEICVPMSVEFEELKKIRESGGDSEGSAPPIEFSGEEGYGKFLDLHECYEKYVNLKGIDKVDYITYLSIFDKLFDIPKEKKGSMDYRMYLGTLLNYLFDFTKRTTPLMDINEELSEAQHDFEAKFSTGEFPGWPKETGGALAHTGAHLDLSAFSSPEELASLGLDRIKSALMALGLKCGGTLEERSNRLFGTKGKKLSELDPSLFTKNKSGASKGEKSAKENEKHKEIASMECQVTLKTES